MRHTRRSSGKRISLALLVLLVIATSVLVLATAVAQPPPPFLGPEDLDGNGTLDGRDFALFDAAFIAYRDTGVIINANADFNNDGRIDYYDAMLMVEAYIATHK
jgi:hypothetical protein